MALALFCLMSLSRYFPLTILGYGLQEEESKRTKRDPSMLESLYLSSGNIFLFVLQRNDEY